MCHMIFMEPYLYHLDYDKAHKVVLAACSPFFRKILNHPKSQQNPFLYMMGVDRDDLNGILNFMYNGEIKE